MDEVFYNLAGPSLRRSALAKKIPAVSLRKLEESPSPSGDFKLNTIGAARWYTRR